MISYKRIKAYFEYNIVIKHNLIELQAHYAKGFSKDVSQELRAAFSAYMDEPPGDSVVPLAEECRRLIEAKVDDKINRRGIGEGVKIEFYRKADGYVNGESFEAHAVVDFTDFIEKCDDVGWRVIGG